MIAALHHMNANLGHWAFALVEIILVAITLCVVSSFFLVVVTIGTASTGAYALGSWWDGRHGKRSGARARERLSSFTPPAKSTRRDNNLVTEKHF